MASNEQSSDGSRLTVWLIDAFLTREPVQRS